jgi:hypothetical protein
LTSPNISSGASLGSGNLSISGGGGIQISGGGNAGLTITGGSNAGLNISSGGASIEGFVYSGNGFQCAGFGALGNYNSTGCGSNGSFTITSGGTGPIFCRAGGSTSGVYLGPGTISWASDSDERFKTTLTPFADPLAKIAIIRSGTGRYLTDDEGTSRSFLSAQSVQSVLPEAVGEGADGMLNLRYTEVIPLLVAALIELKDKVEVLEGK